MKWSQFIFGIFIVKNHYDNTGLTPLHLAICKFDTFVLQFVLHFDFLIQQNPKNQDGLSPHHLAVVYGQFRMCKCCPVISSNWQIQKWLNKVAIYYVTNLWTITKKKSEVIVKDEHEKLQSYHIS